MSVVRDNELIATAAHAFGGHISKGLLKRARSALNRRCENITKAARKELFARIEALPSLWRTPAGTWEEVSEILYKWIIYSDIGDTFDYGAASLTDSCYEKIQALRHIVTRYGGLRRQKTLLPRLTNSAPEVTHVAP